MKGSAGKVKHGEDGPTAAGRETFEETGFDPLCQRGLTAQWKENDPKKITWSTELSEHDMLVYQEKSLSEDGTNNNLSAQGTSTSGIGKRRTCFVVVGVPKDFPFEPVCRKEVSDISWYKVNSSIPKPSFGVLPFLPQLKRYINNFPLLNQQRTNVRSNTPNESNKSRSNTPNTINKTSGTPNTKSKNSTPKKNRSGTNSRGRSNNNRNNNFHNTNTARNCSSRGRLINTIESDSKAKDLILAGLAKEGESVGWSEDEMFRVNEKLIGKKCEYDGNPYVFAEQGFGSGIDPHSFHIVGGALLNQQQSQQLERQHHNEASVLLHPLTSLSDHQRPESRLKHLFGNALTNETSAPIDSLRRVQTDERKATITAASGVANVVDDDRITLQPFFSTDGSTPWGKVIEEATHLERPANTYQHDNHDHSLVNNRKFSKPSTEAQLVHNNSELLQAKNLVPPSQNSQVGKHSTTTDAVTNHCDVSDANVFLTDSEITNQYKNRSLQTATASKLTSESDHSGDLAVTKNNNLDKNFNIYQKMQLAQIERRLRLKTQYETDIQNIQRWVDSLPKPKPTKYFGTFKLDVDSIMKFMEEVGNA